MTTIWKYKKESGASWGWRRRSSPVLRDPSKCLGFASRLMEFSENAETGLARGVLKDLELCYQQESPS